MDIAKFAGNNKLGIVVSVLVIIVVLGAYFAKFGFADTQGAMASPEIGAFEGIRLKVDYAPDGSMKVFALARNNELAKYAAADGAALPEADSIVLGATEAAMMREEGLISGIGSPLADFFGINTTVEGVLAKTGTQLDMFHFLSSSQYEAISGEEGRMFVKISPEQSPKLFYTLKAWDSLPPKFELAEGRIEDFKIHELGGETFYPVIIGADEAKMMREEKLFARTGDTIRGFFGKNVAVVGVLRQSGSAMDMAHFIPLGEAELEG